MKTKPAPDRKTVTETDWKVREKYNLATLKTYSIA